MWDVIALMAVFGLITHAVVDAAKTHSRRRAWTAAPTNRIPGEGGSRHIARPVDRRDGVADLPAADL